MTDFDLQPNEAILLKSEDVAHGTSGRHSDELILTSQSIVWVHKGFLGGAKDVSRFPLNQVKVFDNKAQVRVGKSRGGHPLLEIYFMNGQEEFEFYKKRDVQRWVEAVNGIVAGSSVANTAYSTSNGGIPDLGFVGETVGSVFGSAIDGFKTAFDGMTGKVEEKVGSPVTSTCSSCGAPVTGPKGQAVRCSYCDSQQIL